MARPPPSVLAGCVVGLALLVVPADGVVRGTVGVRSPTLRPTRGALVFASDEPGTGADALFPSVPRKKPLRPKSAREREEELAAVLARMRQLEDRVITLEAERARGPLRRIGGAIGSHVGTTALRLSGKKPLPGLRRLRQLSEAVDAANAALAPAGLAPTGAAAEGTFNTPLGVVVPRRLDQNGRSLSLPSLPKSPDLSAMNLSMSSAAAVDAVGRGASAAVDLAMTTAANVTSPVFKGVQDVTTGVTNAVKDAGGAAIGIVDGLVLEYVPPTQLPSPNAANSRAVSALLSAGVEQQLYDSRRVVLACISLGACLGLGVGKLALKLAGVKLAYSAVASAFTAAYASTLPNRLGKSVRLAGVVCVAIVSQLFGYILESYRSATFVYQTGRWYACRAEPSFSPPSCRLPSLTRPSRLASQV